MFIGVIKDTGVVEQINPELIVKVDLDLAAEIKIESHVALDGRVLRVSSKEDNINFSRLKFYASNLNQTQNYLPQRKVNLERAVCLGEEIPGTFFYGIPTGLVELVSREILSDGNLEMKVSFENNLVKYLSVMDQVCLNGALLQIVDIDNHLLSFNIYPNTLKMTNLGEKQPGDKLSIEIDLLTSKIAQIFEKFSHSNH